MERIILHCDLNNFYASVACHDHPELRNRAVAVCGSVEDRHGIVLAKNMAAKKAGVKTGEAIWQAKNKCPYLVTVPPDFHRYHEFSERALNIYREFSDLVEPFGPDEAWLDVSGSTILFGTGAQMADSIRKKIREQLGLTVSVGVSFNKTFAKLGSDLKKPDATNLVTKEIFREVVWPLPVEAMIGIGPAVKQRLNSCGIYTLGELANAPEPLLLRNFGKNGKMLRALARGEDTARVAPQSYVHMPKSIGRSTTFKRNLETEDDVWQLLLKLSEEVASELRRHRLTATGVQLHLRTDQLVITEPQTRLEAPCQLGIELAKAGFRLFKEEYDFSRPLRSIGIRAIGTQPEADGGGQLLLFGDNEEEQHLQVIERQMDSLRTRFGKSCIQRGRLVYTDIAASAHRPFSTLYK